MPEALCADALHHPKSPKSTMLEKKAGRKRQAVGQREAECPNSGLPGFLLDPSGSPISQT
jgi:hypothetical protein